MLTRTLALLWTSWNLNPVLGSRLDQGNFALSSGRWLHYQSASLYLGVQMVSEIFSGGGGRGNTRDRPTYPPGGITIPIVHSLSYASVFTYADFRCLSVPPLVFIISSHNSSPFQICYDQCNRLKPVKTSSGFGTLRGYYDMIFEVWGKEANQF